MFSAALVLLWASCNSPKNNTDPETAIDDKEAPEEVRAEKALYDQVMQIHDEIMPKMDNIMKAKGQLQERLDSLRQINGNENLVSAMEEATTSLTEADEAMMQWMRNFKPQDDVKDHQTVIDYYKDQEEKIKAVKDQMYNSLEEAEKLLKEGD